MYKDSTKMECLTNITMRNTIKNFPMLFFIAIFALTGCGGGGGGGGDSSSNADNSPTNSATAVVGSSGGTISTTSGASVTIDAGIVKDGTTVTITSEPAPASSSAEITPISSVVRITIPNDSFTQLQTSGSDGISVKIPLNTRQQTVVSAITATDALSGAYKYVKVKGKAAANTVADGWTAYAKFTRDTAVTLAEIEVAVVKLPFWWLGPLVELSAESFIPTVPTEGSLFEVKEDGTFPLASTGIEIQSGKLPLVLVHGIQLGCDGNAEAYKETWKKFRTNFYSDPSLPGKYKLYTFSYQTDLSIQANGLKLATALKAAFDEQQAVVIAHSMGGLVTRSAMVHHAGIGARIGGVITLGTPHHGTVAVQKVAEGLDMICLFAASPSPDGANDMAWDNFDNDAVCDNDFLCGAQGLNTMDTIANLEKYIPYAGVFDPSSSQCLTSGVTFNGTLFLMCEGAASLELMGHFSDGNVPEVSARFTDFDGASGDYYDKYPWSAKTRTYSGIHHVSIHDDSIVFTQNPDGSDGGIAKDLLDFYNSLQGGDKIAFVSYRDGNAEIYVMDADGTNQINLTNNTAGDYGPIWSPDGTKIAFRSGGDGNIHVMDADGSNQNNLMAGGDYPSWSPNGAKIAFASYRDGSTNIYVMDADGSNLIRLTNNFASNPIWSPDGTKIAFLSFLDDLTTEIYVMDADGANQTRLTNNTVSDRNPAWSPDGTKIAFQRNFAIYVMDANGGNLTRLTNAGSWGPVWSPDGTKIAFVNYAEICVMNADGSNQINLTNNTVEDYGISWSPDGAKIAFRNRSSVDVLSHTDIYVVDVNGSNLTLLVEDVGGYMGSEPGPVWQP